MHAPFLPSVRILRSPFGYAASLLQLALGAQANVVGAGADHPAAVPNYTAAQLQRLAGDAHRLSRLICLFASWAAAAGSGQQAGGGGPPGFRAAILQTLGSALTSLGTIFSAVEDSTLLLGDAEVARQALAALEALMRTAALSLLCPSVTRAEAGGCESAALLPLRGAYKELARHLVHLPTGTAAAAELLRPVAADHSSEAAALRHAAAPAPGSRLVG